MKMFNFILGVGLVILTSSFEKIGNPVYPVKETTVHFSDTIITPPVKVTTSFSTRYPKATNVKWYEYRASDVPIDWELTGWPVLTTRDYAVLYELDNSKYYAWYDAEGNWIASTYQMKDFAGLPAPVSKLLSEKYAGYTITDVHAESYKDISAYQVELKKGSDKVKMIVTPDGNVLKQKTKYVDASGNETKEKVKNR